MLKVFISHADVDSDIARALQAWIHTTFLGGVAVFVSSDGRSIAPGEDWRGKIEEALRQASIALIVCTESSLSRPWLGFEAGAAWMNHAKVVPLCYHGIRIEALPLPFSSKQGLDLGRPEDLEALLMLLIREGAFDPSLISKKSLTLPPRKAPEQPGASPDVRAHADFGWLGTRAGDEYKMNRPALIFRIENHGEKPVYLEGGVGIRLKDGKGKLMVLHFNGMPLLRRDLLSGQSEQVPLRLDEYRSEELADWEEAFFRDQIGREFLVERAEFEKAIADFGKSETARRA